MSPDPLLDWRHKGLPPGSRVRLSELGSLGWNVLAGDTGTPVALLRAGALDRNLATMAEFCRSHDVSLAPHAKTHMSPELTARQLAAGAWGFTAAVPHQVAALAEFGVNRVILANELTDPAGLRWAADLLADPAAPELLWYVDSIEGLRMAEEALGVRPPGQRPGLLVEVGHPGGRTGARTRGQALAVAAAVHASSQVDLAGVAGFEGTVSSGPVHSPPAPSRPEAAAQDPRGDDGLAAVEAFLRLMRDVVVDAHAAGFFPPGQRPIVTAGGSVYFDRVVAAFGPLRDLDAEIVLRSGCYLTHDDGMYDAGSPSRRPGWGLDAFEAAIEVWGRVLSRPEPDLVLVNFGRRDVSFDAGLPTPKWFCRRGADHPEPATGFAVTGLSDQHAFVRVPSGHPVAVGDLLGAGVSHPCTTFDRWRLLLLTDDQHQVIGGVRTFF